MIKLSVWFESLKWRIRGWRSVTLCWPYLSICMFFVACTGVAEVVAVPHYVGYAKTVFSAILTAEPVTPSPDFTVAAFQWLCSITFLLLAYRQWARRQFKWMIACLVFSLLLLPAMIYVLHEMRDQHNGTVYLKEPDDENSRKCDFICK